MNGSIKTEGPNIEQMCRLCLREDGGTIEIFDASGLSLPLRIMACVSIEVKENDALPKYICWECRVQLEKSYVFRKQCKTSDDKLHKHVRLTNAGKVSKVFVKKDEIDDDDYDYELEQSFAFLEKVKEEERQQREAEREELAEKLKETIRTEEIEKIFEDARSYLNARASQHQPSSTTSSDETLTRNTNVKILKKSETIARLKSEEHSLKAKDDNHVVNQEPPHSSYPELLKEIKETYNDENSEDEPSTYYVIKQMENADEETHSTTGEGDDSILIADYNEETEENEGEIQAISLESFEDCSQEASTDQIDAIDENTDYLQDEDHDMEAKDEEELDANTFQLEKNTSSPDIIKFPLKQYTIQSKSYANMVKIAPTNEENIYVMEIHDGEQDENDLVRKEEGSTGMQELKIFKCQDCPQAFSRRALLQRHQSVHIKNKGYSCELCEKWFACKSSLDRHTRVHTGEKPFECNQCGRRFIQKEILKRHMITHTGIRPHKCQQCEKSFAQKQLLRQHINLRHTENPVINMHKCFLCPKSFFHASGLSRHLLIHSGVSFKCDLCDKKFNDKSAVKRHTMTVHAGPKILNSDEQ